MTTESSILPPSGMSKRARYTRMILGSVAMLAAILLPSSWGWLGIYPFVTGLAGITPVFTVLGIYPRR